MNAEFTFFLTCLLVDLGSPFAEKTKRPSILFITVDNMNRDSVGVFDCSIEDITPNVDKLVSEQFVRPI